MPIIMDQESFPDMRFPEKGIDLSRGFGSQLPGTTPIAQNVRLYEPDSGSARGGSRPGLGKYVSSQPNGSRLIQHINAVVYTVVGSLLDATDLTE